MAVYVSVAPVHDLGARGDYLEHGVGSTKKEHAEHGTNRLAAMRSDHGTVEAFIEHGQALAAKHGRTVQGQSYIFSHDDLDPTNPDDVQLCADLAYEAMTRMNEAEGVQTDLLVVVHVDGKGSADHPGPKVHAHGVRMNHDNLSGKAIRQFKQAKQARAVANEVQRDHGRTVMFENDGRNRDDQKRDQQSFWEKEHAHRAGESLEHTPFGDDLYQRIVNELQTHRPTSYEEFKEVIKKADNIDLVESTKGDGRGLSYKAIDTTGDKPRVRRRKASKLSNELTRDGLDSVFEHYRQEKNREHQEQQQQRIAEHLRVARERLDADRDLDVVDVDHEQPGEDGRQARPSGDPDLEEARRRLEERAERNQGDLDCHEQDARKRAAAEAEGRKRRESQRSRSARDLAIDAVADAKRREADRGYGIGD